jgi:hypothetical protein
MFNSDKFKLKIEWTFHTGWNVKVLKMGCDIPVVEVNNYDIGKAMEEAQSKLFEYLESESD